MEGSPKKAKKSSEGDSHGLGRTPMFALAALLFIVLLAVLTRSHTDTSASAGGRARHRGMGMGSSGAFKTGTSKYPSRTSVSTHKAQENTDDKAATVTRIAAAKSGITEFVKQLEKYWSGAGPLQDSWSFAPEEDDELAFWVEKIGRAIQHGIPLTVGMIGSSVAAGHDNCNYDSFEKQLERNFGAALAPAGINFTVKNAGQGGGCGDNMFNQVWCLRHLVGDDVDFTIYSWTYFEAGKKDIRLNTIHEAFVRWSLLMDRAPAPTLLYATTDGSKSGELHKQYAKFGFNVVSILRGVLKHGLAERPAWGVVGDGKHTTTRYGENETEARKKSLGVMYRNWHPGPLGFQVAADAYAWRLAKAALKAIAQLEQGTTYTPKPALVTTSALGESKCADFDKPTMKKSWCDVDEPPNCMMHMLPAWGRPQIQYATKSDTLNPMVDRFVAELEEKVNPDSNLIPRDERDLPKCKHFDHCRGYRANFMTYRLPRMQSGVIKVCCVHWDKCHERLLQASFYLDSKKLPPPKPDEPEKCVLVEDKFEVATSTGGHFYLSIDMAKAPNVYISHVIAL